MTLLTMTDTFQALNEAHADGVREGWQQAIRAAVKLFENRADAIQRELPFGHGGDFATKYARSALIGVAALIEQLQPPARDDATGTHGELAEVSNSQTRPSESA